MKTQSIKVLVADDTEANRDILVRRLVKEGYTVAYVGDGRQALASLHAEPFDLVLLDITMPELNGFEVLERMKADPVLSNIPVIVTSPINELDSVVKCIESGAEDYLAEPFNSVLLKARISASLEKKRLRDQERKYTHRLQEEKELSEKLLHAVIPIGVALSAEKDFNRLLEKIVMEAMTLCNADGGTLYLRTEDNRLKFVIIRNRSLNLAMGGSAGQEIPFLPLPLYHMDTGALNYGNVATFAALKGVSVNIADAYHAEGFDFSGTKAFDQETGYRSKSFLTIPLKNVDNYVIGVLQLLNAQNPQSGEIIPFDEYLQQLIESLSALATVALEVYIREQSLRRQIEELRIEIDEVKKARQVAEITDTQYFRDLQAKIKQMRQDETQERKKTE